jgi:hypothetical protein
MCFGLDECASWPCLLTYTDDDRVFGSRPEIHHESSGDEHCRYVGLPLLVMSLILPCFHRSTGRGDRHCCLNPIPRKCWRDFLQSSDPVPRWRRNSHRSCCNLMLAQSAVVRNDLSLPADCAHDMRQLQIDISFCTSLPTMISRVYVRSRAPKVVNMR